MLEPLTFQSESPGGSSEGACADVTKDVSDVCCVFCEQCYNIKDAKVKDEFLAHLVSAHKLVIADVKLIADFTRYVDYWREKFKGHTLTDYCSIIKTNTKDSDPEPSELFYLLCDALPEDKDLRIKLQQHKLEEVLAQQQKEREDTSFSRGCLFCRTEHFDGDRSAIFHHMATKHSFNVGHPDNLVYTDEFLDVLQQRLDRLECFYCEREFKDRFVLKEHMRKKGHKRLNTNNKLYDRFYTINYLELGKNWKAIQSEDETEIAGDSDTSVNDDWSDWREDGPGTGAVCLFCQFTAVSPDTLLLHLKEVHGFDLEQLKRSFNLHFYQQVKLVNYIRRQVYQNVCMFCEEKFPAKDELLDHMTSTGHMTQIPASSVWDQPQYFFPTYEDDNLLCVLDDDNDDNDNTSMFTSTEGGVVIAEDVNFDNDSILRERSLLKDLMT